MKQREKYTMRGQTGNQRGILCEGDITKDETQTGDGRSAASFVTSLRAGGNSLRTPGPTLAIVPPPLSPRRSLLQTAAAL